MITVRLFTFLNNYYPENDGFLHVQYEEGLTIKKVLEQINLDAGMVGLILVNGRTAGRDYKLFEGDSVELYPIFGGG